MSQLVQLETLATSIPPASFTPATSACFTTDTIMEYGLRNHWFQ
jgi:hypothetical protein